MTGTFVALDGPSGVGKSTVAQILAYRLTNMGRHTVITREPSDGPIGILARTGTHQYTGMALACLVAADRYHHLRRTIRPALDRDLTVLCDRYLPSSLVLQAADGVPADTLWHLNAYVDRPDLTIILVGDPAVCRQRAETRGIYSRFHGTNTEEPHRYRAVAEHLVGTGHNVLVHDIALHPAEHVAADLLDAIAKLPDRQAEACETTSS